MITVRCSIASIRTLVLLFVKLRPHTRLDGWCEPRFSPFVCVSVTLVIDFKMAVLFLHHNFSDTLVACIHSRQQGVCNCRPEGLEEFIGRHRIFFIPLYLLPPTENFFV